jgi:hypothetical protein
VTPSLPTVRSAPEVAFCFRPARSRCRSQANPYRDFAHLGLFQGDPYSARTARREMATKQLHYLARAA